MTKQVPRRLSAGATSALVALIVGGLGQTVRAQSDGAIHACVNARGAVRIVAANEPCGRLESPLSWNVEAPEPSGPQIAGSLTVTGININIFSLSWGNQSANGGSGGGGAPHPVFSTFNVVKGVDLLTPRLLNAGFVSQHLSNVSIVLFVMGTTAPLVTYLLEDALVSSVNFGVAGGQVTESVSLVPAGRMITTINMPGAGLPSACWDISRNVAC
jgi:type VI protein secretion system component Hcp